MNILGRPTSSANVTTVPPGPMTHLMVLGPNACDLANLACVNQYNPEIENKNKSTRINSEHN